MTILESVTEQFSTQSIADVMQLSKLVSGWLTVLGETFSKRLTTAGENGTSGLELRAQYIALQTTLNLFGDVLDAEKVQLTTVAAQIASTCI